MSHSNPIRRAVVIAVQQPLDHSLPARPAAVSTARRVAVRLQRGGWDVRLLVDDAAEDAARPLLANILVACAWLEDADAALAVISADVQDGCLVPRDARAGRRRTWLPIEELFEDLPLGAGLVFDGPLDPSADPGFEWCAAAGRPGAAIPAAGDGPSRFFQATALALGNTTAGLTGAAFLEAVAAHAGDGVWSHGEPPAQLLAPVSEAERVCAACDASISEARATFCPSCGAPLDVSEQLDNGRYRLLKRLGAGGMGQVFLADDTRLNVRRALKLLSLPGDLTTSESDALKARMIQEARAAQTLADFSHHVVRVFDVGFAAERGEPYLVMELLDGETLSARIARGRLPFAEAMRIARTLAATLAEAHARGFVHRDLKPDNIMLCRRGEQTDFIKILDFGLVKAEQAEVKTESGRMMGTLQYMPPEQLRGQPVDARADVFSLAAVLYECFSGTRANPGKTQHQIFGVLLDRGIPSLSKAAPALPTPLVTLIDRCLRLDRAQRPADASEVLAALAAIPTGHGPVPSGFEATIPPTGETPSLANGEVSVSLPPPRDRRPLWGVLAALVVLGLVGWWGMRTPTVDPAPDAGRRAIARPGTLPPTTPVTAPPTAPPTEAAPQPLGPPVGPLPAIGQVVRTPLADGGARYLGDPARVRAAIAADHTLEDPGVWADLSPETRAQLAAAVDWRAIMTVEGGAQAPSPPDARRARVERRPIATLLVHPKDAPIVTGRSCRGLEKSDRVLTVSWTIFGYGGGRCRGAECAGALARALQKARRTGERLSLTFTVARGGDDTQTKVRCAVRG